MNTYAKGAFLLVMALMLIYVFSLPKSEDLVKRSGAVVYFYRISDEDTVYRGCATLEDTTIDDKKALKVFKAKETERFLYDEEKGVIKRKQKTPQ